MSPSDGDQLGHLGMRAAAEAALVVEELDDGDAAFGVAADVGEAVVEDRLRMGRDQRAVVLLARGLLPRLEQLDHLGQDLGVREQVGADLGVQRPALGLRHGGAGVSAAAGRAAISIRAGRSGRMGDPSVHRAAGDG